MSRWLFRSRKELKLIWLRYNALTTNKRSILVIVLFGIVPLIVYFIISTAKYSLVQLLAGYVFVTLLFGLSVLLVIAWFRSVELFKIIYRAFRSLIYHLIVYILVSSNLP